MKKATVAAAIAAMGLVGPTFAQDEFSYTYLEVGYVSSELDESNADGDGFRVHGSYAFTDQFFGFASYSDQDYDFNVDASVFEVGVGTNWALSPKLDLEGTVSYLDASVDAPGFRGVDDNGLGVGAGLRGHVSDALELRGGVEYENFDKGGSDTTLAVGARYYFTKLFALAGDIGFNDDGTTWMLGARFDFGNN